MDTSPPIISSPADVVWNCIVRPGVVKKPIFLDGVCVAGNSSASGTTLFIIQSALSGSGLQEAGKTLRQTPSTSPTMVDLPDGNLASWAVAAGTLFLGVVAYYQARLLVRERKANQAREMMEKIYLPLRAEVRSWLLPEGNDFGHWKMVNDQYPHLTPSVPDELGPIFVEAGPLMLRIQTLSLEVRDLISKASRAMTEKMRLHSNVVGGSGYVSFGVLRAGFNDAFFVSYLKEVWLSGKSLTTYLSQRVEEQWPGLEWTMDIRLDGQPAGNMQQAQEFSKGALEMLVHPPSAREYREKLAKKKDLADKALSIINSQIEKYSGIFKPLRARIKSRFKH